MAAKVRIGTVVEQDRFRREDMLAMTPEERIMTLIRLRNRQFGAVSSPIRDSGIVSIRTIDQHLAPEIRLMTPDAKMPDISPDMRDFLELLIKHDVQFALCGVFAVTYYGFIRTTMDIDILVYPSATNASRIMLALAEFGFGNAGIEPSAFENPGTVITLGAQPNQIDLLTSMSTEGADAVFADLHVTEIWGMRIPVVSRHSLLRAKKEAGRPKDRIDYEELVALSPGNLQHQAPRE